MYKYLITIVNNKISVLPITNENFVKEKSFEIDDCTFLYIGYYYTPETQYNDEEGDEQYYDEYKLYLPIDVNRVTDYIDTDVLLDNFDKEPLAVHVEDRRINLSGLLPPDLT